jgi:signal transduction histidine kinase
LREIARELHDEFGQLLTAMGSMIGRVKRQIPEGSALRGDLGEVSDIAQSALDNVRGLSQTLHPSILEELGLESTIDWYLSTVQRQLGLVVAYERTGDSVLVDEQTGIHVYRVLQEALANVARHAGTPNVAVRLRSADSVLELEVEDHGRGLAQDISGPSLGLFAMRERASLIGGTLEFLEPAQGGTLLRLRVPLRRDAPVGRGAVVA